MSRKTEILYRLFAALLLLSPGVLQAQAERPSQTLTLAVDATEAPRKILHARETIPVHPGPLTLLYPKWIPGEHGPTGPLIDLVGIRIAAGNTSAGKTSAGKTSAGNAVLPWRRDLEEMYAIHCEVPPGVDALDVSFDFILPPQVEGFSSGASSSAKLLVLSWNQVVLYPDTAKPGDITVTPSLTLPEGWQYASALKATGTSSRPLQFAPVSLTTLVDSPVMSGAYLRRIDLTPASGVPHFLNVVSDNEAALAMSADQIAAYRRLVTEASALFGAHHYNRYDFLYTLSDQVAHFGLEHHESSDDRVPERSLLDDDLRKTSADLLPHEFVHSWNGKYRRPAGLATGDFSTPMKGELLWVYEGLTQYLGKLLTARSGLRTPEEFRDDLALLAARLDNRPGRQWRPLQDVNDEAQLLYYSRGDADSLRRSVDFYDEGDLIWLEADVTIRQLTKGKKSLDDFCRRFHGGESGAPAVKPYTFEDVVSALDQTAPHDWKTFLTTRLQSLAPHAPMGGIEKSGWRLAYRDMPSDLQKARDGENEGTDLRYSLGLSLGKDGALADVIPGTPAAKAGLASGMKIIAVNGRKYSADIIHDALKLGLKSSVPLELLAENGEFYQTFAVDYHGGDRYPYLERDSSQPDLLSSMIRGLVDSKP